MRPLEEPCSVSNGEGAARLVSVNEGGAGSWSQSYGYDRFGNRWVAASSGLPVDPRTPDSSAKINAANNRLTGANYGYDAAGNQTAYGGWTLGYDAENRLVSSQPSGGSVTTYAYDGEGRRVRKTTNGVSTVYVYAADGELAAEYGGTAQAAGTRYLTADHLGSVRLVTDGSGNVLSRHDYLPFGEEIPAGVGGRTTGMGYVANPAVTQKFTGKERDAETGLDYFGARYLSGVLGRFSSPDPLHLSAKLEDPQTWNRYAYGLNNPLRYSDPEGLYPSPQYNCSDDSNACLNDEQRRILENSKVKVGKETLSGEALWKAMGEARDAKGKSIGEANQNAFVNVTDRLASLSLGGSSVLSQVNSISGFAPDRIFANVGPSLAASLQGSSDFTRVGAGMHSDYNALSFKDWNVTFGNVQFSFNQARTGADIDIDIGNVTNGLAGAIVHAWEVTQNAVFGTKTNQDTVRRLLINNPNVHTITPSLASKWNRP